MPCVRLKLQSLICSNTLFGAEYWAKRKKTKKSQGSEFPGSRDPPSTRLHPLPLTGITRGKRLLVLIGQKKALGIAVRNDRPQRRYSGLLASLKNNKRSALA